MFLFSVAVLVAVLRGLFLWRCRQARTVGWWSGLVLTLGASMLAGWLLVSDMTVQKLVAALIMPLGLIWLACWVAMLVAMVRRAWGWAALHGGLVLLLVMAASPTSGQRLAALIEAGVPSPDQQAIGSLDAVIVLGGGTDIDARGEVELGQAGDRLRQAAALWHAGHTSVLVAGGTSIPALDGRTSRDLGAESAALWAQMGIPASAVVTVPGPTITRTEMAAYGSVCVERGWQRVGLVSSATHLPRVLRHAHWPGVEVVPIPCDHQGFIEPLTPLHLVPQGKGADAVARSMWEVVGRLAGR